MNRVVLPLILALPVLLVASCELAETTLQREKSPRPVTVIELQPTSPRSTSQLTGSVASWKTEEMGFQVQGRVESVLEPGQNIRGRTVDETGQEISQGTVIAALEREPRPKQEAIWLGLDDQGSQQRADLQATLREFLFKGATDSGLVRAVYRATIQLAARGCRIEKFTS